MALRYTSLIDLPELRTPRLILRPIREDDAQAVYDAIERSRDDFSRWFVWSRDSTLVGVQQNIRETISSMIAGSEWHYAIFEKESDSEKRTRPRNRNPLLRPNRPRRD